MSRLRSTCGAITINQVQNEIICPRPTRRLYKRGSPNWDAHRRPYRPDLELICLAFAQPATARSLLPRARCY